MKTSNVLTTVPVCCIKKELVLLDFHYLVDHNMNIIAMNALSMKNIIETNKTSYRLSYICVKYTLFVSFSVTSMLILLLKTITLSLGPLFP